MHLPSDLCAVLFITGLFIDLRFVVSMENVSAHYSIFNIMELASPCGRVTYGSALSFLNESAKLYQTEVIK